MRNESINIKPDREYLRAIVNHIASVKYAVPIFQRDFVWSRGQVLNLFDSILKGYPIGSILLWKPPVENKFHYKNIITDDRLDDVSPEYCVLDGRQRLTAIYGCVTRLDKKNPNLCLYYDLENEELTYTHSSNKDWIWSISDIYDTFSLLNKCQSVLKMDDSQKFIERAQNINSILQTYEVSEIKMSEASLDEAQVAFTRLNSKGTPISDWYMHQALAYDDSDDRTLNETLNDIRQSLHQYGYDEIKEDDVLACCYRYAGKRYFENIKEVEKVPVINYMQDVGRDLCLAASFLHDECFIFSPRLFPYSKLIVPLCYFFKNNPSPTQEQKKELARWIIYSIYTQQPSGSLASVRQFFEKFDKFTKGEVGTACDEYQKVAKPSFDFTFATGKAMSSVLLISMIRRRLYGTSPQGKYYSGNFIFVTKSPAGVVPLVEDGDYQYLRSLLRNHIDIDEEKGNLFSVNSTALNLLYEKDYKGFLDIRTKLLFQMETEFLTDFGIEIEYDK